MNINKPVPTPRVKKQIPLPHKSVKQMVQEYEGNIIPVPFNLEIIINQFQNRTLKPVPAPRTKITPITKLFLLGRVNLPESAIKLSADSSEAQLWNRLLGKRTYSIRNVLNTPRSIMLLTAISAHIIILPW